MSKKKNKKKKRGNNGSFYKTIKPFIKDSRVLYTILGAAGVGVALASAFGSDKGHSIIDSIAGTLKNYGLIPTPEMPASEVSMPDQPLVADKKVKGSRNATI